MARSCRSRRPRSRSSIAASCSPTASTRSPPCWTASWSTTPRIWRGWSVRSARFRLRLPESIERIIEIQKELIARNKLDAGLVYLEVTRGADKGRDFAFPKGDVKPTLDHVHLGQGHRERGVGQDRHRRDHRARHPLDAARHQERGAAGAGAGQAGRGGSRRGRSLDDRGRQGHRGRLVLGLHPDPGRRASSPARTAARSCRAAPARRW